MPVKIIIKNHHDFCGSLRKSAQARQLFDDRTYSDLFCMRQLFLGWLDNFIRAKYHDYWGKQSDHVREYCGMVKGLAAQRLQQFIINVCDNLDRIQEFLPVGSRGRQECKQMSELARGRADFTEHLPFTENYIQDYGLTIDHKILKSIAAFALAPQVIAASPKILHEDFYGPEWLPPGADWRTAIPFKIKFGKKDGSPINDNQPQPSPDDITAALTDWIRPLCPQTTCVANPQKENFFWFESRQNLWRVSQDHEDEACQDDAEWSYKRSHLPGALDGEELFDVSPEIKMIYSMLHGRNKIELTRETDSVPFDITIKQMIHPGALEWKVLQSKGKKAASAKLEQRNFIGLMTNLRPREADWWPDEEERCLHGKKIYECKDPECGGICEHGVSRRKCLDDGCSDLQERLIDEALPYLGFASAIMGTENPNTCWISG